MMRFVAACIGASIIFFAACSQKPYAQGERLYALHCANCHGEQGQGLGKMYPPLANADFWRDSALLTPSFLLHGRQLPLLVNGVLYEQAMPKIALQDPATIANIMNFIENEWYGGQRFFTREQVEKQLERAPWWVEE